MKKFTDGRTDGRTDAEGYSMIRPFFKRAYKNYELSDQCWILIRNHQIEVIQKEI